MDEEKAPKLTIFKIFKWAVKLSGLAMAILYLVIFFGEGPSNLSELTRTELFQMICLSVAALGLIIAAWKQLIGGIIAVECIAAFTICEFTVNGPNYPWFFTVIWAVGFLSILCGLIERKWG